MAFTTTEVNQTCTYLGYQPNTNTTTQMTTALATVSGWGSDQEQRVRDILTELNRIENERKQVRIAPGNFNQGGTARNMDSAMATLNAEGRRYVALLTQMLPIAFAPQWDYFGSSSRRVQIG